MTRTSFTAPRALVAAPLAVALALASVTPAAADPDGWHHHGRPAYSHHDGGHGDAGAALALGLITGLALGAIGNAPAYRSAPPRYTYVQPGYSYVAPAPAYRYYAPAPAYRYDAPTPAYPYYTPAPAPVSPLAGAFTGQDRQMRLAIQQVLAQQGYYTAGIDGIWGPATRGALTDYARAHGALGLISSRDGASQLFARILGEAAPPAPPVSWQAPGET